MRSLGSSKSAGRARVARKGRDREARGLGAAAGAAVLAVLASLPSVTTPGCGRASPSPARTGELQLEDLLTAAAAAEESGDLSRAERMLREVLERLEKHPVRVSTAEDGRTFVASAIEERLADVLAAEMKFQRAAEQYRALLAKTGGSGSDSRTATLHYRLAACLRALGKTEESARHLASFEAIERERAQVLEIERRVKSDGSLDALVELGGLYASEGKWGRAARAFEEAIERAPNRADLRARLARVRYDSGEFDAARREVARARAALGSNAGAAAGAAEVESMLAELDVALAKPPSASPERPSSGPATRR